MYDNYHYPAGSDNGQAPWNEADIPEEEFEITCSQSLSRTATVLTNNYIPGASGVDWETDDEGHPYASGWHDDPDTSDTNWAEEYHDNDHYTPLELINKFKEHLMKQWDTLKDAEETNDTKTKYKKREIQHLIDECSGWTDDETEYLQN